MAEIDSILINGTAVSKSALRDYLAAREFEVGPTSATISARPAFVEQFLTGFYGRGMLTTETINVATEQLIITNQVAGDTLVGVTTTTNYVDGGRITIKHDNGLYHTYHLDGIGSGTLGVLPPLLYPVTGGTAKVERTWYNRAHAGKFYIRQLAQRIARTIEAEASIPDTHRFCYLNFESDPFAGADVLAATGTATVYAFDPDNIGETGTVASPVRFPYRSAYVEFTAAGAAATTLPFTVSQPGRGILKIGLGVRSTAAVVVIDVLSDSDAVLATYTVPSASQRIPQIYTLPFHTRDALELRVRVRVATWASGTSHFIISSIDAFAAPETASKIIGKTNPVIVVIGDSWVEGDTGTTAEREPLTTQLALELPSATIYNAGVGGENIRNMVTRFDADVAAHDPDFVVVHSGVNECYSPLSATFEPNGTDDFNAGYNDMLSKIAGIGARPIICGIPALGQTDADFAIMSAASWSSGSGGVVTLTTSQDLQKAVGESIVVSGMTPSGYNGTYTLITGTTGTTLKYAKAVDPGAATVLGSIEWVLNDRARRISLLFNKALVPAPTLA